MTATAKKADQKNKEGRREFVPFYTVEEGENGRKTKINPLMLIKCYRSLGFRRYDMGNKSFLLKITDNIIEQINDIQLMDEFEAYVRSFGDNLPDGVMVDNILTKYYHQMNKYTAPKFLSRIGMESNLRIQEHGMKTAYFYYKNGFVEVTADSVKLKPYSQLEGKVWKSQILDRDFKTVSDYEDCNFAKFVKNISNYWKKRFYDGTINKTYSKDRYIKYKQMIGNGLHSYVEGKMRAIILTDSRTDDAASGRSGKTLILKAMGHMLNANRISKTYAEINGKDFDMDYKFKWQELDLESKLVHLNDAGRNFDFEGLFNDITEGVKCQHKNEMPFLIRPKIYITTNRTIRIEGESAKDRSMEFETADYYKAGQGPDVEFGEWFFRDWDEQSWQNFDNFMIHCVQLFLKNGLQEAASINLEARKMKEETSPEFCDWMQDKFTSIREADSQALCSDFSNFHPDFRKFKFPQRTFNKWMKLYATYHPSIKDCVKRKSNNKILITYVLEEGVDDSDAWLED